MDIPVAKYKPYNPCQLIDQWSSCESSKVTSLLWIKSIPQVKFTLTCTEMTSANTQLTSSGIDLGQ